MQNLHLGVFYLIENCEAISYQIKTFQGEAHKRGTENVAEATRAWRANLQSRFFILRIYERRLLKIAINIIKYTKKLYKNTYSTNKSTQIALLERRDYLIIIVTTERRLSKKDTSNGKGWVVL